MRRRESMKSFNSKKTVNLLIRLPVLLAEVKSFNLEIIHTNYDEITQKSHKYCVFYVDAKDQHNFHSNLIKSL